MSIPANITQPELALILGLTCRQVRNLTDSVFRIVRKEGNIVFYHLADSVNAFIAYREHLVRKRLRQSPREAMDLPDQHPP